MKLLGFSGKMGVGKTTCLRFAKEILERHGYEVHEINFSDAIYKEIVIALWPSIKFSQGRIQLQIEYIKKNKDNFRLILQGWGTDCRRNFCGKDYWLKQWSFSIQEKVKSVDKAFVLVGDVRFKNEFDYIKALGGSVWRVERDAGIIDTHQSEIDLDNAVFDKTIYNSNTLLSLQSEIEIQLQSLTK